MHTPHTIVHRDLTDKNILLNVDGVVKIGDQSKLKTADYFSTGQPGYPFHVPKSHARTVPLQRETGHILTWHGHAGNSHSAAILLLNKYVTESITAAAADIGH